MNDEEARDWLKITFGSDSFKRLERFSTVLLAEAERQSLISRSTFVSIWSRHIADSAQLVTLAPTDGSWIDVGSGGGLPGVVVAMLRDAPLLMVEPRRKRADFLKAVCLELGLPNTSVVQANVQAVSDRAAILSARAVSNMLDLFDWTKGVVSHETLFLLPRGENAVSELDVVQRAWQGEFHVEQSITNPSANIVVARQVRPR